MKEFSVTIEGVTPLICNKFTDEAQASATSGSRASTVGDKGTPREIAESKLYTDSAATPIIPGPNLFRCLIDAGKFFKAGKSKLTTLKSSLIPAALSLDEVEIQIVHDEPWEVDSRPVRIPATGGRIIAHRPMFNDWRLSFHLQLDDTVIGAKMLRDLVDAAGQRIGLGDFRPDCKGMFGKFKVVHWKNGSNGND